ncbi:MAG TPA: proton-conducting transporter membrane subunit [Terriglobales bacterium]|nr:proton-conducting transporter membrane subunit [Terriglobales bacterium]
MSLPGWVLRTPVLTGASVAAPWIAAVAVIGYRRQARVVGCIAALLSAIASTVLVWKAPEGESLYETLMLLFSCVTFCAIVLLPRRDSETGTIAGILLLLGATLLAYSTGNLLVLLGAWILSIIPFLWADWFRSRKWRPMVGLLSSSFAIALAIGFMVVRTGVCSISDLKGQSPGGVVAFILLIVAAIFRKGIIPAQAWVADAAESGPLVPTALLLNGHFGALLVVKLIVPLFPETDHLFPVLSYLAVATAVFVAIRALRENSPRRLLAFLALSQSACILSGLESRTAEGITGALVHWVVVTVSTVSLFGILRLLEVRFGENLSASKYLGLAEHAPRLAVSFAILGLALVGLPGTLGFCSEDLLIQGTLTTHPLTGLLLPMATAMNAVSFFRLFSRLFLGKRRTGFTVMADALPRERCILAGIVLFVVLGGLFPNATVIEHSSEVDEDIRTFDNLNRGTGYFGQQSSMQRPTPKPKRDVRRATAQGETRSSANTGTAGRYLPSSLGRSQGGFLAGRTAPQPCHSKIGRCRT